VIGIVGVMNMVNFLDGLDGLAAGVCAISGATFSVIELSLGRIGAAVLAAIVCGACLGFLRHNFYPARIFMGDSGARVGFIGLYRNEETLQPVEYYVKLPQDVADRDVILLDPMLATGNSTAHAVKLVKDAGATSVRLIAIIAAPEGIKNIQDNHPDVQIVVAAIDRGLNEKGFIVPGLGDAGDRLYGTK